MTRGWASTSAGVPEAMTAPGLERDELVAQADEQRHVVLDHDHRAAQVGLHPAQHRHQRLGLALGDAGGRLVEQDDVGRLGQHAGQLDDAPGAGGQLAGRWSR